MRRGDGCLFVPTRVGVAVAGVPVRAPGEPAPTWWAHHCGVAWMAAWLTVRPREFKGSRELTLILLDTIKAQALKMREADPCAVGFRRPAA